MSLAAKGFFRTAATRLLLAPRPASGKIPRFLEWVDARAASGRIAAHGTRRRTARRARLAAARVGKEAGNQQAAWANGSAAEPVNSPLIRAA